MQSDCISIQVMGPPSPPPPLLSGVSRPTPRASQAHQGQHQHQHGVAPTAAHGLSTPSPIHQQQRNFTAAAQSSYQSSLHALQPSQSSRALTFSANEESKENVASSGESECPSDNGKDLHPGRRSRTTRTHRSSSLAIPQAAHVYWSEQEDAAVIASVKRNGQQWVKVKADLDRKGVQSRSISSIVHRYLRLVEYSAKQRDNAAVAAAATSSDPASSAALPQQQQPVAQSAWRATVPLDLQWTPRQTQPWTKEEEVELLAIGRKYKTASKIFEAWVKRFPTTIRTAGAVRFKWHTMVKGANNGDANGAAVASSRSKASTFVVPAMSSTAAAPPKNGRMHSRKSPLAPTVGTSTALASSESESLRAARESFEHFHGNTDMLSDPQTSSHYTATPTSSGQAAREEEFHDSQLQSASLFAHPRQVNDCTITRQENGFLIENLPPAHQLHILTPMQYRLVAPQHGASLPPNFKLGQQAAPFIFEVAADGSVHALASPAGTTSSIALLLRDPQVDEEGRVAGQGAPVVERRFEALDGYVVTFHSL